MEILTAWDLQHGKRASSRKLGGIWQPIQMVPKKEKDEEWKKANVDWFENLGLRQLQSSYRKKIKNYRLAKGIIDTEDYCEEETNEFSNILTQVKEEEIYDPHVLSLSFFPIIPNVIKVLSGEFSKRNTKITVQAVDEFSKSEKLEAKMANVREHVEAKAKSKLVQNLLSTGYQPKSEEEVEQLKEELNKKVASLPEIQELYRKNYRSMVEQWAQHQLRVDEERFKIFELENIAFKDFLVTDSEFWHINLKEDDYKLELWSPLKTFYHKSPEVKYVSEGNYVGMIDAMSIPDVIDRYGYDMTDEQIQSLEHIYSTSLLPLPAGSENAAYYDPSRSKHDQAPNSIALHQYLAAADMAGHTGMGGEGILEWLNSKDSDPFDKGMVRVTEVYWKSQKRVGYLTRINEDTGETETEIVTEDYQVINEPLYNTTLKKKEDEETLIFGEHIEWFWINEVWRGRKINTLLKPSLSSNKDSFDPIYLKVEPLPFQFKAENDLWNSRLPVEGLTCSDTRLNVPTSIVDLMKPYQVIYNLVNNQIKDILIDEIGTVVMLDPNALPKNSMGEDWGKGNLAKAYVAMKDFQILPLDHSLENIEGRQGFQHYQQLDLEQSNRLFSRLRIGEWAKNEALSSIGITPQRMGAIQATETATTTRTAVENSYSQTEDWFVQHINFLMPRVKEMLINAAQFYNSDKPSINLQYSTSEEQTEMFTLDGYKLLPRDIQVFTLFRPDSKAMLDQMKMMVMENNTTNANIYDLLKIVSAQTPSEVIQAAQKSVEEFKQQTQQQQQHEQELLDKQLQAQQQEKNEERAFEANENALDRQNKITESTIRAMGFSENADVDANLTPDVLEIEKFNAQLGQYQEELFLKKEQMRSDNNFKQKELDQKDRALQVEREKADKALAIAKENKTAAELKAKKNKPPKK